MMLFSTGTGLERVGSLGWTRIAGGPGCRLLDGQGCGRIAVVADRPALIDDASLQEQARRGVGEGFARGRSDA